MKNPKTQFKKPSITPLPVEKLIENYKSFEWMYDHTNEPAIADYCHDEMESTLKVLEQVGVELVKHEPAYKYEALITNKESPFPVGTWIPVSEDRIKDITKIDEYIKQGTLRKVK